MALRNITRQAVLQALAEYDRRGGRAFLAKHGFSVAKRYWILHEGRSYPSKAIVGVAHGYLAGHSAILTSATFTGGQASVVRILRMLGFTVIDSPGRELNVAKAPSRKTGSVARPPIVYFNIGWMKEYRGTAADDPTIGAHRYLDHHLHGGESFNFFPTRDGTVRGYRPPGEGERTNITRLGARSNDSALDGVLVVWLAREPGSRKTLIIGWYENATVFRHARDAGIDLNGERIHYAAEARAEDATLLPPVARTFNVRSSRTDPGAGFGQKPTWYGAAAVDARVWAYVRSRLNRGGQAKPPKRRRPPRNVDPELRRKVEKAAVAHAVAYYELEADGACEVVSVEAEAKGWDLEVWNGRELLLVEVKGLLNPDLICELTPNEYAKMMHRQNRRRYVVYVVNNALSEPPAVATSSIFVHVGGRAWRTADGRELQIRKRVAAVLTCR